MQRSMFSLPKQPSQLFENDFIRFDKTLDLKFESLTTLDTRLVNPISLKDKVSW